MNRQQAVRKVADHTADRLLAADFEEVTGVDPDTLGFHDRRRLELAIRDVADRLRKIGPRR